VDASVETLAGQTALVTGGAKRIGRGVVLALARAGANVVIHYGSSADEAEEVRAQTTDCGVRAWTIQADLADTDAASLLVERAHELAGPLDALINNASIYPANTLLDMSAEDITTNMQVNAISPFLIARSFANQNRPGAIINLLDTRITEYDNRHAAYHVSKRALFTLTRMMAMEFAPSIRVNGVAPGLILPPPGEDETYLKRHASTNPLERVGSVDDVTEAVLFLLRSRFITGQVIYIDGGYHMKGSMYGC
jgi:NAD(P)-dependent dehydrogenase (short-subunit alcohol dehydrogenase family)